MGGLDLRSVCLKSPPLAEEQSWRPRDEKRLGQRPRQEKQGPGSGALGPLQGQRERNRFKKYLGGRGLDLVEEGMVRAEGGDR